MSPFSLRAGRVLCCLAGLWFCAAPWEVSARPTHAPVADAAEKSERTAIRALLRQRADVNAAQPDGMTALHWAVQHDDLATARLLVEAKANVKANNHYGVPPLLLACQTGNEAMVELLLANGADANTVVRGGETVLMTAARTGKPGAVRALLKRGADVNAKERRGQTALMWAAADGHLEVVELLLQAGADLHATLADSGFSAWFFAARDGRAEVVRAFLKAGVDVNRTMAPRKITGKGARMGTSALLLAVENAHFNLALELVDAGANPNDQRSGFTPLHVLTWVRKPQRGEDDGDPAPVGSGNLNSAQFIRELVKRGADVNARLTNGRGGIGKFTTKGATPFLMASATADVPYMQLLVELGADPSIPNADNCTPLMVACGIGVGSAGANEVAGEEPEVLEAAQLLLKLGANLDAVDANGETAMHGAALKNLPKVVHFLARRGAKVEVWNKENKYGWTPLMLAQGYRPGNFKPSFETVAAIQEVMLAAGVTPPVNARPADLNNSDWSPLPKKKKPESPPEGTRQSGALRAK
jgi:ankyrin repeat protein